MTKYFDMGARFTVDGKSTSLREQNYEHILALKIHDAIVEADMRRFIQEEAYLRGYHVAEPKHE